MRKAKARAGLTFEDLWIAYVGLGGNRSLAAITSHIEDDIPIAARDHDLLVDALNDHFVGLGMNHPYAHSGAPKDLLVGRAL
ncbi:MAG TPA: hypothetical protein VG408_10885 [Actinomycetota bacterium]|nr:hypothetical protein [Actinomycetota bacterium]